MWRKNKYYVLHGMTLNWWFTVHLSLHDILILKRKPGFFTSTESGRGITGTAVQKYIKYLILPNFQFIICLKNGITRSFYTEIFNF